MNSDSLSVIYVEPLRDKREPKFDIGGKIRITKLNLSFRNGYRPQFEQKLFEIVALAINKPSTYTKGDEQFEIMRSTFYERNHQTHTTFGMSTLELVSRAYGPLFPDNQLNVGFFARATASGETLG